MGGTPGRAESKGADGGVMIGKRGLFLYFTDRADYVIDPHKVRLDVECKDRILITDGNGDIAYCLEHHLFDILKVPYVAHAVGKGGTVICGLFHSAPPFPENFLFLLFPKIREKIDFSFIVTCYVLAFRQKNGCHIPFAKT